VLGKSDKDGGGKMKKVLTGDQATAESARLCRVQVISAYPITPQTIIVERLSEFVADGELSAEFIKVESEHSALSACVGASAAGARAFTATSSQGLALMGEILHIAAGLHLPIVMVNVNRSLSAPLSIWCDQQDSISMRDTGWVQLYCENNQEVMDSIIQAYRLAESISLPVMVCFDGYIMSHTAEPVDIPEQSKVDEFLPPFKPVHVLDPKNPITMGAVGVPEYYEEFRYVTHETLLSAKEKLVEVDREFRKHFGRGYGMIESYRTDGADIILLTMGSLSGNLKEFVDLSREHGEAVGMVKLKLYRPFPAKELTDVLKQAKVVGVMEKDISLGYAGGLYLDLAAAFANQAKHPLLMDFVCGLGGRDVTFLQVREALKKAHEAMEAGEVKHPVNWLGLREEVIG
jgi:pyruvate ferredoxin oxidoreductase alpha subunit